MSEVHLNFLNEKSERFKRLTPNQYVGLEELDDGFYCVWYCNVKLGYLDESKLRIEDDLGRLKRNML